MPLSKPEWTRRVKAAAALHGWELTDLVERVAALAGDKGLPKNAAARAGHPSDDYGPNHALALVLAELLEVPVAWFEAEDWRPLIQDGPALETLDQIAQAIQNLRASLAREEVERAASKEPERRQRPAANGSSS